MLNAVRDFLTLKELGVLEQPAELPTPKHSGLAEVRIALDSCCVAGGTRDVYDAFDAATCIGCGACVAACPNGSAMLFTAAKVVQLALLPQGRPDAALPAPALPAKLDFLRFPPSPTHPPHPRASPQSTTPAHCRPRRP